jgi:hypothetical protein
LLDQSANELLAKETFSAEDLELISARLAGAGVESAAPPAVLTVSSPDLVR